jgi:hypothetical protein
MTKRSVEGNQVNPCQLTHLMLPAANLERSAAEGDPATQYDVTTDHQLAYGVTV